MSALAQEQLFAFLGACRVGCWLLTGYGVMAGLSQGLKLHRGLCAAGDFLFWLAAGAVSFLYLLAAADGRARVLLLAGEALGAAVGYLLWYRPLVWLIAVPAGWLRRVLCFIGRVVRQVRERFSAGKGQEEPDGGKNSPESGLSP